MFAQPEPTPAEFDVEAVLAGMMDDAMSASIQQEYPVVLQNDSWSQTAQAGDWAGLIFNGPSQSYLEHCVVEFAQTGVQIVNAVDGEMTVRNSVIQANWLGILCSGTRADIIGTTVVGHKISPDAPNLPGTGINPSGTGMYCIFSAQPVVSYSTFGNNELNGVGILDTSRPTFGEIGDPDSPGRNKFRRPLGQNFMFNGTTLTIYAQQNFWELLPGETVEDVIFDDTDAPSRGPIIWGPVGEDLTDIDPDQWRVYR
jgi:hypothetical protein